MQEGKRNKTFFRREKWEKTQPQPQPNQTHTARWLSPSFVLSRKAGACSPPTARRSGPHASARSPAGRPLSGGGSAPPAGAAVPSSAPSTPPRDRASTGREGGVLLPSEKTRYLLPVEARWLAVKKYSRPKVHLALFRKPNRKMYPPTPALPQQCSLFTPPTPGRKGVVHCV